MSYEARFIQCLARLGRCDMLARFKYAFCYIDDLCLINITNPREFLSPDQPRLPDNPFWIYPLHFLEIKEETSVFSLVDPGRGISVHFMNVEITINEMLPTQFLFRKFDKRHALPFQYTQYIKFKSNPCVRQAYNIAISQVLPILYISSSEEFALKEIDILIKTMISNGFNGYRLLNNVRHFLENGSFPGSRVDAISIASSLTA